MFKCCKCHVKVAYKDQFGLTAPMCTRCFEAIDWSHDDWDDEYNDCHCPLCDWTCETCSDIREEWDNQYEVFCCPFCDKEVCDCEILPSQDPFMGPLAEDDIPF